MAHGRKYRRCPGCGAVRSASELLLITTRGFGAARRVRCPVCGHEGLIRLFAEVEPPKQGEAAEVAGT
jgi:DNA-directed RNA polymerase subunit RPC12/RpoP